MNLHLDENIFEETLINASRDLDIPMLFLEKDYWITLILNRLSKSKFADVVVFKGGTSLSKGFNVIERFSEDVDIAILNVGSKTANEVKTLIRNIEKEITKELKEVFKNNITSKGSKFRKTVFEYNSTKNINFGNQIIVETNSFANPYPFQKLTIKSMIFDYLKISNNSEFIEKYNMQAFELNVLCKEQTMIEKLMSLIRFSYNENIIESISGKIRHFYDLHYLIQDADCKKFIENSEFKSKFLSVLQNDKEIFDEPQGWQAKSIAESPLVLDFPNIWKSLRRKYREELLVYAFKPIPDEKEIAVSFEEILKEIKI